MKKIITIFSICNLLFSCDHTIDNKETKIGANAGEDQISFVGSYSVLDISKSIINEPIDLIEWIQDAANPQEMNLFAQSSLNDRWVVGFEKDGIYKFTLSIKCKSGNVYTDSVIITVKPRQISIIEDIYLEARIRYKLNYKEGGLNAIKLMMLDTLLYADFILKNYKTKSIKGIENCSNLIYLPLSNESITDLTPLSALTKLEFLDLNQNYTVEDISPLTNLVNLKKLILYSNPIKDISPLANLTNIVYLDLLDLPINDINSLSNLINLETLYASGVGVKVNFNNISSLNNLTKLTRLDLAGRGIVNLKPIENLTELILLQVSYDSLTEISSVSKMKKLIRLYIRRNKVDDISGIKNLENLDYLDAADNQIKDISELQYLPAIHLIGLDGNKIEDISPLVNNPNLGKGVYLYLKNNPLSEKSINEYIPILIARGVTVYY